MSYLYILIKGIYGPQYNIYSTTYSIIFNSL